MLLPRLAIFALLVFLAVPAVSVAQTATPQSETVDTTEYERVYPLVALLPLANYTSEREALEFFHDRVEPYVRSWKFRLVAGDSLRPLLRQYRVRAIGMIGTRGARLLKRELDVDYVLTGSIDIFRNTGVPELALSFRLVSTTTGRVVWAKSEAAHGEDFVRAFGVGTVTAMEKLADRLLSDMFKDLGRHVEALRLDLMPDPTGPRVAIVPFDNLSVNRYGGDIVTALAITVLVQNDVDVIEPGVMREIFLERFKLVRGEIDAELATALYQEAGVQYVITGAVEELNPQRGSGRGTSPDLWLGARIIDAANLRIINANEMTREGGDFETVFRLGVYHSLGKLTMKVLESMFEKFETDNIRLTANQ